jgi:hypothetical protein
MSLLDAIEGGGRFMLFVLDVLDSVVSPWHWWRDWRRTSSPVSFFLAIFSALSLIGLVLYGSSLLGLF